jgi:transposase
LAANENLPVKQRYTGHLIFKDLVQAGYRGGESTVRRYIAQRRQEKRRPKVYLPLEFDPGIDAQVDWGEAVVEIAGERLTVQIFYLRLCYSRMLFMMAFPAQKQEAFFEGHVQAFHFIGGVPHRISYDNPKVAVQKLLPGHTQREQLDQQPEYTALDLGDQGCSHGNDECSQRDRERPDKAHPSRYGIAAKLIDRRHHPP